MPVAGRGVPCGHPAWPWRTPPCRGTPLRCPGTCCLEGPKGPPQAARCTDGQVGSVRDVFRRGLTASVDRSSIKFANPRRERMRCATSSLRGPITQVLASGVPFGYTASLRCPSRCIGLVDVVPLVMVGPVRGLVCTARRFRLRGPERYSRSVRDDVGARWSCRSVARLYGCHTEDPERDPCPYTDPLFSADTRVAARTCRGEASACPLSACRPHIRYAGRPGVGLHVPRPSSHRWGTPRRRS
ncbi:hypothetical protein ThrDRAFT_02950 [Frankia casuarinae]|jgi:hypothetical protein|nr:hypothetical protein CcI6DRAFT_00104 [Frankia sp. CcI6]EYT91424.1 hypothetical protein ThrDRAFT_02950 [Frankia casuarinae]KEZ38166.1 hypothetical protein CEDDRAFT_00497 [Frankia sp. CeD]KFB06619.1 hypothetical protein ALLO2DRAFT_00665 [Frankia sp. Allo2]OAA29871.1 hypothetical protein AAY23_101399 [Frankia casuarinae]